MTSDIEFARSLAAGAGEIMRQHFRVGVAHESKGDGSPVTVADHAINQLVIDRVREEFPDDAVIGEEASSPVPSASRVWVCDPIDGTMPFTFGVPTNMFSLALVSDGEPVLAVLYDPYVDRLYEASHGRGATVNGVPMRVNDAPLDRAVVALPGTSFGLTDNAALVSDAISRGMRVVALGSVTYESALVASGQITACVFPGTSVWDIAAVKVIVEESGGRVTDIDGRPQRYDGPIRGALISNDLAHDDLVAMVRNHL